MGVEGCGMRDEGCGMRVNGTLIPHPSSRIPRYRVMHGLLTRDAFRATVAEGWEVDASEQMLAGPEQYWRHRELHLIDQPGLQVLANGLRAAKETNVLAACRGSRTLQRRVDSVGDEVED